MKNYIFLSLIFYAFSFSHGRLSERYHTYEEVRDSLFSWNEQFGQNQEPNELYPGSGIIYYLEEIGVSSHEGLPFWGVRLSFNADQNRISPEFFFSVNVMQRKF